MNLNKKIIAELKLEDFASLFGTTIDDISDNCRDLINKYNFKYRIFNDNERGRITSQILEKINSGKLSIAGKARKDFWEIGWRENFRDFLDNNCDADTLIPKYVKYNEPVRLNRNYIEPQDPMFGLRLADVFKVWIFEKYLKNVSAIYEFGCGTGYNLLSLAKLFPEKALYGLDWVDASADIIDVLAKRYDYNLKSRVFDMFSPDWNLSFQENSAVITFHSLEQLGPNFEKFLKFLLAKSPIICLNIEPIYELYDENNPIDCLASKFHKRREYLDGYLTRLIQLERDGEIEMLKTQRVFFGTLYQDSYSFIAWRVKQ